MVRSSKITVKDLQIPNNDLAFIKRHFCITPEDESRLPLVKEAAKISAARLLERMHTEQETRNSLTNGPTIGLDVEQLTSGLYDASYFDSRLESCNLQNISSLSPKFYVGSFAFFLDNMVEELAEASGFEADEKNSWLANFRAVLKLVMLDIAITFESISVQHDRKLEEQEASGKRLDAQRIQLFEQIKSLSVATNEISSIASELATATVQSGKAISETTAFSESVMLIAEQTSKEAKGISQNTKNVLEVLREGQKATESTIEGMARITEQMRSISSSMTLMKKQSRLIGDIINTVDDLAQQSNLLAINASIEAAKAGDHGKGFSVVADEVKSLSQQSKEATASVRNILGEILKATTATGKVIDQGTKAVDIGHQQAANAGTVIKTLSQSIEQASTATQLIEDSSQQQLIGMQQVVQAMESVNFSSKKNSEKAFRLEESGKKLTNLGNSLLALTSHS